MDIYNPIEYSFTPLPNDPKDFSYYEIRVWRNHQVIKNEAFTTLKEARKYYKKKKMKEAEDKGWCYVEIIHVKPLKKYQ